MTTCDTCGRPIPDDVYPHHPHEAGCPNRQWPNRDYIDCTCDITVHPTCCPCASEVVA